MLGPVTCKCGLQFTSRGAISNHVRWQSPDCRKTREQSRREYAERYPERAAASYAERQIRYRTSALGRARFARMEERRPVEQRRAKWVVKSAVKSGRLTRGPCADCGAEPAQGHHHNGYGPGHQLDVVWLCPKHHSAAHRRMRAESAP